MDPLIPLLLIVALAIGLVVGWLAFGRSAATLRRERDKYLDNFRTAITDLAGAEERAKAAGELRVALAAAEKGQSEAKQTLARLEAERVERDRAFEARLKELREAKDQLAAQFSETAGKLLNEAQAHFLKRADERFHQAGEKSEAHLKALLQPVEATLKRYEEGLAKVEKDRVDSYAGLREAVEQVRLGQTAVKDEAARLVNALRSSPKARGRWGEQQLRNVLEMAGLSEHADFQSEVSVNTDDGRLRPDVIVRLPGGKQLIIDAKCSLNAYLDASETVDDAERTRLLTMHAAALRNHANQLGQKAYWSQFGDAADYVVMFIPGEHFLSAALEQDHELWQWAFDRRVLLATPTNLIAIARTVSAVWRQEKLAEEAATIAALGKELHARLATMGAHVGRLGRNLELATGAYNAFVGSLESQVMSQARRFEALEVAGGAKSIEDVGMVEALPRPLKRLAEGGAADED
ncbi:MAG: DNA recombination protein RmuC [Sphingomonas sanxanigenens]|uniref:DNA recombination protein RmuC homolog n=1 Tax=Sphingomonas sanxanigenens TaxID=397260 RepID=A0A2W5ABH4_9SPHN|nr:MAG: DNA recombination protein RmuC [Sphingomonas sanxanigenens]